MDSEYLDEIAALDFDLYCAEEQIKELNKKMIDKDFIIKKLQHDFQIMNQALLVCRQELDKARQNWQLWEQQARASGKENFELKERIKELEKEIQVRPYE